MFDSDKHLDKSGVGKNPSEPMLPVVVVDFDSSASSAQQQVVLGACNQALADTECVSGASEDARTTRAVAVVSWLATRKVQLEVGIGSLDRWITHELVFGADEPTSEQWRAIGYSIATLVGDAGTSEQPVDGGPRETTEHAEETVAPAPAVSGGVRVAPRVAFGLDRPTTFGGGELSFWVTPSAKWTPLVGIAYVAPVQPSLEVHWREFELEAGVAWRQAVAATELRLGGLVTLTRIGVSDENDSLEVWVPGARLAAELRWPRASFWALATQVSGEVRDGSTAVTQKGESLGSSPSWLFLASSGLELRF